MAALGVCTALGKLTLCNVQDLTCPIACYLHVPVYYPLSCVQGSKQVSAVICTQLDHAQCFVSTRVSGG